jgi:hypothetical protein
MNMIELDNKTVADTHAKEHKNCKKAVFRMGFTYHH